MFYCEPMPLEATGDNVQLTAFVAKATNSTVEARPFLRTCVATRTCLETHVFQPPNCPELSGGPRNESADGAGCSG